MLVNNFLTSSLSITSVSFTETLAIELLHFLAQAWSRRILCFYLYVGSTRFSITSAIGFPPTEESSRGFLLGWFTLFFHCPRESVPPLEFLATALFSWYFFSLDDVAFDVVILSLEIPSDVARWLSL